MRWAVLVVVTITLATHALAHVAPSVDDNNRYLKLTPQADRVRLAYTVFFGERPGAALRPALDTDKDRTISDAEAQAWGDRIAADVIGSLELAIDGRPQRLAWKQVIVGLGTPSVAGGSFSIDMIAYACLPAGATHELTLRDRFRVPKPGETEVRVEDGRGITVELARIAGADALANDFKFVGPGGPLSDDGLHVRFRVSDEAPRSGECDVGSTTSSSGLPWLAIGGGAVALLAIGFGIRARAARAS